MANSVAQRRQDQTDAAAEWLARLRAHDITDCDRVRFVEWFVDAENRAAFDEVQSLWECLQCVSDLDPQTLMRINDKA